MLTENDYKDLSEYVYWVDPKHKLYDPDVKEGIILEGMNSHYKIFNVEDNTANGMQTMAVAPVINDKSDPSSIAIFYAGTNPKNPLDAITNI